MSKWTSVKARTAATWKFCEMLDADVALRKACQKDKKKARDTLKRAGNFTDMPANIEVYVFENQVKSSDKVVTLVLPKRGELPPSPAFDPKSVWLCSWSHYVE